MTAACVRVVTWLFPYSGSLLLTSQDTDDDVGLYHFLRHVLRKTRTQPVVMVSTLLLLLRFRQRRTHGFGLSRRKLLITALMIASKTLCDTTYSNRAWVTAMNHLFTLHEINGMERQFFREMGWRLTISSAELFAFIHMVRAHFGARGHRHSPAAGRSAIYASVRMLTNDMVRPAVTNQINASTNISASEAAS